MATTRCTLATKQYVDSPARSLQPIGSRDAAVGRTGMYLQRDCKQRVGETIYSLSNKTGGLLIGVVGGAYHRATGNLFEAQRLTDIAQLVKLIRRHKTINGKVI